jgi:hypothetical protein
MPSADPVFMNIGTEILINASLITHDSIIETYEFIIDDSLTIKDSIKVKNLPQQHGASSAPRVVDIKSKKAVAPVVDVEEQYTDADLLDSMDGNNTMDGMLFELNHVRVNPRFNNEVIIKHIINKLKEVGVSVNETATQGAISMRFKPIGEINSSVRFYVNQDQMLVFMSPMQPKLVRCS